MGAARGVCTVAGAKGSRGGCTNEERRLESAALVMLSTRMFLESWTLETRLQARHTVRTNTRTKTHNRLPTEDGLPHQASTRQTTHTTWCVWVVPSTDGLYIVGQG